MKRRTKWIVGAGLVVVALIAVRGAGWLRHHVQTADREYDTRIASPTYTASHPGLCIDAAHHNFETQDDRYGPFASLAQNDGYAVRSNHQVFSSRALDGCQ